MPRPKRTEAEIEEMRERILDAALVVLHEQGPAGLSIRSIADCAGVSHMVLYSYFEDHDDLMAALRRKQRKKFIERRSEQIEAAKGGEVDLVVRELLERYVRFAKKNPGMFHFLWMAGRHHHGGKHGRVSQRAKEGFRAEMNHLAELIDIGIRRGVFLERDPEIAALTVSGMINGPLMMYQIPGRINAEHMKKLETEIVEASMHYLTGQE